MLLSQLFLAMLEAYRPVPPPQPAGGYRVRLEDAEGRCVEGVGSTEVQAFEDASRLLGEAQRMGLPL